MSPERSTTCAASSGRMAPPMMPKTSRPEVEAAGAVDRSSVRVKMLGNMMELKKPTARAA
ncbi:hypothetical protein D3C72_1382500 [compost metagenome]